MINQRKHDDKCEGKQGKTDFEKGSDSKKPQKEKEEPKPLNIDKREALKGIPEYVLEARAKLHKCKHCSSSEHQWLFCMNAIKESSSKTKKKDKSLKWKHQK
jgi:hypothetical protein